MTVEVKSPKLIPTVTVYGADFANTHVVWYKDFTETDAMNHGVKVSNSSFSYLWVTNMLKQYVNTDFLELPDSTAGNALNGELSEPETTTDASDAGSATSAASTSATTTAGTAASTTAATTAAATTRATTAATTASSVAATTSSAATGPTVGEGRITNGPVGLAAAGN